MPSGGCHCGAVRYEFPAGGVRVALCHCDDCRRHSGAPAVGWAAVPDQSLKVSGRTAEYRSSENGRREFCQACGTSLFYRNAVVLPGIVDVQTGTLDPGEDLPPGAHIQTAERLEWMTRLGDLPAFERYPEGA